MSVYHRKGYRTKQSKKKGWRPNQSLHLKFDLRGVQMEGENGATARVSKPE